MDEDSLALRRQFVRLGDEDRELLAEMAPWAQSVAKEIAKEFYDWQFQFGPTREFFENIARERNMPLSAMRSHLEAAQAGYLTEVFAGASVNWDLRYFEKRLHVGTVHNKINLPFKWYIGAYPEYQRLLAQYLRRDVQDDDKVTRIEAALGRVFNLDLQAIGDAFVLNTLEGMLSPLGIRLDDICAKGDRAEQVGGSSRSSIRGRNICSLHSAMADEPTSGDIDVAMPVEKFTGSYAGDGTGRQ